MSLLTVIQNAMALCSLPVPSQAFNNTNDTVIQMVRLLDVVGKDLIKRHDWRNLLFVKSDTTTSYASSGEYNQWLISEDFDRMARGTDVWNITRHWPVHGPVNSEEWRDLIARNAVTLPQYWRIIGGYFNMYGAVDGDDIQYEYISKYWIYVGGAVDTANFVFFGDTDTFVFPEHILELGLVWRWKAAKSLDYAEDMRSYEIALRDAIDSDKGGRRTIGTDRAKYERPFKSWPGTITPVS
jgi:hypothetical protein